MNLPGPVQSFCKEVVAWKTLRHPNVLPLLGVTMTDTQFVMVSEWMGNGNINAFVKAHTNVNRLELVRFSFRPLSSLDLDDCMVAVARRSHQGFDLYA